jgi:hypothetical protein
MRQVSVAASLRVARPEACDVWNDQVAGEKPPAARRRASLRVKAAQHEEGNLTLSIDWAWAAGPLAGGGWLRRVSMPITRRRDCLHHVRGAAAASEGDRAHRQQNQARS